MARTLTASVTTNPTGTITEAFTQPPGTIPADGSIVLKSAQPTLAAMFGDNDLKYDVDQAYTSGPAAAVGGIWAPLNCQSGFYADLQTDGTQFVYTNGTYIFVSTTGVGWKPVCIVPQGMNNNGGATGLIDKLKYRAGVWFAYAVGAANNSYLTSTDAITWTLVPVPFTFQDMTWDGTNYMFVDQSPTGAAGYSYFGSTLALAAVNRVTTPGAVQCVEKIGTNFVAWNNSIITNVYLSTAGVTWTTQATGQTAGLRYSIANGNLFIARFPDTTGRPIYVASPDGVTWTASGTSVTYQYEKSAATCVIWDGTKYSMGARDSSGTTGKIYVFTTISGSATPYNNSSDTYQNSSSGNLVCYRAGIYIFISDYGCGTVYVTTATPAANWLARGSYAQGTAYPFYPNHTYGVLAVKDSASTRGGVVTTHQYYVATAVTYIQCFFLDDTNGYYTPYKFNADYWALNMTTNAPTCLALAISNDAANLFTCYSNGTVAYVFTPNHSTRVLTSYTIATAIGSSLQGVIPTKNSFIVVGGFNTGFSVVKFDGGVANSLALYSLPGLTTGLVNTVYGISWNYTTGSVIIIGIDSTPGASTINITFDGLTWQQTNTAPALFAPDTITQITTPAFTSFSIWHTGKEYILSTGANTFYRGTNLSKIVRDLSMAPDFSAGNGVFLTILDTNKILVGFYISTTFRIVDLRGPNRSLPSFLAGANMQCVSYEFSFGTLLSFISGSGVPSAQIVVNLLKNPVSTSFKVPKVSASIGNGNKQVYINT